MTVPAHGPGAPIAIAGAPNLRDLGGWPTADGGTVRRGVLFRSAELNQLAGVGHESFTALGIRSVYDLRTEAEREAQPDALPAGVAHIVADVLADETAAAPADLLRVVSDPAMASAELGGGKALTLFEGAYRDLVSLPSALSAYRLLFSDLLDAGQRPALFHCTTGKDRTGWAAAATLLLLGVPEDLVRQEYLLTNDQLLPALSPVFDRFSDAGGDPALLRPVLGVEPEYLTAALDELHTTFGGIEGYFADGLGLDPSAQTELRQVLLEPA